MQNQKGLFVLNVKDDYLETLEHTINTQSSAGESRVLQIWNEILENIADETKVSIEKTNDFHPMVQYILEQMTKGEKPFSFYYDGDFNDNIWSFLCERTNIRVERPIRINLSYVLNEEFVNYERDSERSDLYIHNLLRLISQIPAFDVEIYEAKEKKSIALFSYEDVVNGIGFCEKDRLDGLYFCLNDKLGELSLQELHESFLVVKAMSVKEKFTDFIDVLKNREEQIPAYVYLPHIYLYMGSQELKEKMYRENAIDRTEYEIWSLFHFFMNNEKVQDARFIIASKALSDAFEHGFVKVHGSVMQLEKYKNYFLEDIDQLSKKFVRTKTLVLDSGKSANVEIPNVMNRSKHTFLIELMLKIYSLSRL